MHLQIFLARIIYITGSFICISVRVLDSGWLKVEFVANFLRILSINDFICRGADIFGPTITEVLPVLLQSCGLCHVCDWYVWISYVSTYYISLFFLFFTSCTRAFLLLSLWSLLTNLDLYRQMEASGNVMMTLFLPSPGALDARCCGWQNKAQYKTLASGFVSLSHGCAVDV